MVVFCRNSASASDASTPRVLPPKWISSIFVGSTSFSHGSMSARVLSLRPFPSRVSTDIEKVEEESRSRPSQNVEVKVSHRLLTGFISTTSAWLTDFLSILSSAPIYDSLRYAARFLFLGAGRLILTEFSNQHGTCSIFNFFACGDSWSNILMDGSYASASLLFPRCTHSLGPFCRSRPPTGYPTHPCRLLYCLWAVA